MSRVDEVLRLRRQGWTPSRIARDLRMPPEDVASTLDAADRWEKFVDEPGTTAEQVIAALERVGSRLDEEAAELAVSIADELDAKKGWSPLRRRGVLFDLEHIVNGLLMGEGRGFLVRLHFRMALKSLASPDEPDWSAWPSWLRSDEAS